MTACASEKTAETVGSIPHERRRQPLGNSVAITLQRYFHDLDGSQPHELYEMVISEVEYPLLQIVMKHVKGNQSKAAEILGINRGTLRKKLARYGLLD